MYKFNPFSIYPFATGIGIVLLGLFVVINNLKGYANRAFGLFCFVFSIWLFGFSFQYSSANEATGIFWSRIVYLGVCFASAAFYHFIRAFLKIKTKKWIPLFLYLLSSIFFYLCWIRNGLLDGVYKYYWGYFPKKGPLHPIFIVYIICVSAYTLTILFKRYRETRKLSPSEGNRIRYVFIAFAIGNIVMVNFFPTYGVPIFPIADLAMSALMIVIAYAIVRHQLLDIEVIIKKTLVFAGLLASVFLMLILPTLIIQEYLFRGAGIGGRLIGLSISGIIIIFTMRKIESSLINVTDRYLFQKKYDYKELLKTFTEEVLTVLDLRQLIALTKDKLTEIIKMESCDVSLFDDEKETPIITAKGERIIPLTLNNRNIGVLKLGKKKSDEDYTQDDMDILLPLARTLAIAISNAQLFDELGKAQAEAAQKEKMATIGTLAAGMAHEIRNPITTIKVFSEYLPDKLKEPAFMSKYKNIVIKEIDKIDHIIQTMVDFSTSDAPSEVNDVSLNEAVDDVVVLIGLDINTVDRIKFVKNILPSLPKIRVNKKDLDEILLNLIQNAIHAIKDKGIITFSASEDKNSVRLGIQDTGCGMSEDVLKHIFSPFFTTKSKGFGLGLFVVKELVKRNSGKVFVESKVGEGTKFDLEFQKAR